jgi:hypothetical protein
MNMETETIHMLGHELQLKDELSFCINGNWTQQILGALLRKPKGIPQPPTKEDCIGSTNREARVV